jgi:hypothetical protein
VHDQQTDVEVPYPGKVEACEVLWDRHRVWHAVRMVTEPNAGRQGGSCLNEELSTCIEDTEIWVRAPQRRLDSGIAYGRFFMDDEVRGVEEMAEDLDSNFRGNAVQSWWFHLLVRGMSACLIEC